MVVKTWTQAYRSASDSEKFKRNLISNDIICDMYTYDSEDSSHRNDPEHEIVYVNELKKNEDSWYADKVQALLPSLLCRINYCRHPRFFQPE